MYRSSLLDFTRWFDPRAIHARFSMGFIPLILGAASLIGGAYAAKQGSKAANKASDMNARMQQETNAQNLQMFNQSRGAPGADGFGHSILPTYFGGSEEEMGRTAYANFNRLNAAGLNSYNNLNHYQGQLMPAMNSSFEAMRNRYNGEDLAQRMAYAQPMWDQRLQGAQNTGGNLQSLARSQAQGIDLGLMRAFQQMNAQRAAQGFGGSSLFDRNRIAQATIGAQQAAASQLGQANLQAQQMQDDARYGNLRERFGMQMQDMDTRANPAFGAAAMESLQGFFGAPAQALSNSFSTAMQPMNYFRIAPQAFQNQNMPEQAPRVSNGQILGSALGAAGSTAANYFMMQDLAKQYGGGAAAGPAYMTPQPGYGALQSYQPSVNAGNSGFMNWTPNS